MNRELVQLLLDVCEKYDLKKYKELVNDTISCSNIKIGFIGNFSAGKTSLINSILGTKLPVSINPTTKSVCMIEPTEGQEGYSYFEETVNGRFSISFMEFMKIVNGEVEGVAVIKVPTSDVLPMGCVFVDTPGIDSASGTEGELTMAFLQYMDAAIVCVPVMDGTIKASTLEFLNRPELVRIRSRLAFVLTMSDLKAPDAVETVKGEIANQSAEKLGIHNANQRIIAINSNIAGGNAETILDFLRQNILGSREAILAEHISFGLRNIAMDVHDVLQQKLDGLEFDEGQYDRAINDIDEEISKLNKKLKDLNKDFEKMNDDLHYSFEENLREQSIIIASASNENELKAASEALCENITNIAQNIVGSRLDEKIKVCGITEYANKLTKSMQAVSSKKDACVGIVNTAIIAAVTAGIGSAATVAGNAAEAGLGMVLRQGAAAAAKAGKNSNEEKILRVLSAFGDAIDQVNPVAICGEMIANNVKNRQAVETSLLASENLADSIINSVKNQYEEKLIKPIQMKLQSEKENLIKGYQQKNNANENFDNYKSELRAAVRELENLI